MNSYFELSTVVRVSLNKHADQCQCPDQSEPKPHRLFEKKWNPPQKGNIASHKTDDLIPVHKGLSLWVQRNIIQLVVVTLCKYELPAHT